VSKALKMGANVDLAIPSKMIDTKNDIMVAKALKTPKIVFTLKQIMRNAANSVELTIDSGE